MTIYQDFRGIMLVQKELFGQQGQEMVGVKLNFGEKLTL